MGGKTEREGVTEKGQRGGGGEGGTARGTERYLVGETEKGRQTERRGREKGHRERERHTQHTQRQRQTDRQRQTQTERNRNTEGVGNVVCYCDEREKDRDGDRQTDRQTGGRGRDR